MIRSYRNINYTGFIAALLFLLAGYNCSAQRVATQFIDKHAPLARALMAESGIPASVILGVSMIESAMGTSRNCKLLKNYFGVKGSNKLHLVKGGHRSAYKQYPTSEASFRHFISIVQDRDWYDELKGNKDYELWLKKLNHSGYAQAKGKWIKDINMVIRKYDLADYDRTEFYYFDDSIPLSPDTAR
jgi:flagellum-specific peptidoglycan hydrolase FlgJ